MFDNSNCETRVIAKWIWQDRKLNQKVSRLVIKALKKSDQPAVVCKDIASSLYDLFSKKCDWHGDSVLSHLAACTLVTVDWDEIAIEIMKEIIFSEEPVGERN